MKERLKILAIEPYYGGSHRFFIDSWVRRSRHRWTLFTEPPNKWKWRMRHGSVSFARRAASALNAGQTFDLLFCTDMLNLAEFRGLVQESVTTLPTVIYFHENQLTYPNQQTHERDMHFAFSNFSSCLAADQIWFNSRFHQSEFFSALEEWLQRMPPPNLLAEVEIAEKKSFVRYPGIELQSFVKKTDDAIPTILWAARWEHDKNPEQFFEAMNELARRKLKFKLIVLGESFTQRPKVFDEARATFSEQVIHFGFAGTRAEYLSLLAQSDIVVSTALHEFFGISVVEAIAAGAFPLLPNRLAYPEILEPRDESIETYLIYDGQTSDLIEKLLRLVEILGGRAENPLGGQLRERMARFDWAVLATEYDDLLVQLVDK